MLEVGARDTLPKALEALAFEGHIAFPFEEAVQAYDFMDNGSYFGKIVIRVGS